MVKSDKEEVVEQLIIFLVIVLIYLILRGTNGSSGNGKHGDGNSMYDYSDYINKRIDDEVKKGMR